jgi:predicted dithiol-disulfide oxidoreductase (DUF899 family)
MQIKTLGDESPSYQERREELRLAELAMTEHIERVAALRRMLPDGPPVRDYEFEEGPADLDAGDAPVRTVRLRELFTAPDRPLIVYHLMFGKQQSTACPMCTMWIDGFNGVVQHVTQNVDFVVAAAAEVPDLRAYARAREWRNLRLLSCARNTFKLDMGSEDETGGQRSYISVFRLGSDGTVHHFYSTSPSLSDDLDERGIDLLSPVWNLLDLTPQGRRDWYAELSYR